LRGRRKNSAKNCILCLHTIVVRMPPLEATDYGLPKLMTSVRANGETERQTPGAMSSNCPENHPVAAKLQAMFSMETKRPDFRPASSHTSTKLKSSLLTGVCRIPPSTMPSTYWNGRKPPVTSTGDTGDRPYMVCQRSLLGSASICASTACNVASKPVPGGCAAWRAHVSSAQETED